MAAVIVALILFLDQLSKFIIQKNLLLNHSIPLINGVFHLTLVHNRGAAFGILKNQAPLFIFTSILAIVLIYFQLKKDRRKSLNLYTFSLCLVLGGALGNLIDRFIFGYVIDFLDFRVWPVFNLADSVITTGAIILSWSVLRAKN